MKIALINPQTENLQMRELYNYHENHALGLLYANIKKNPEYSLVSLFDLRIDSLSERDISINYLNNRYDVIVLSVNYATLQSALLIVQIVSIESKSKPKIILGGEHASYLSHELIEKYPHIDIVCRGEGESTLPQVLNSLYRKMPLSQLRGITFRNGDTIIQTKPNKKITDLDTLNFCDHTIANRAIINNKKIEIGILTKRGCPYPCSFCNAQRFLGNGSVGVRYRSPKNVVDEIKKIASFVKKTGGYLRFYDATFVTPSKVDRIWLDSFCSLMEKNKIRVPIDAFIRSDSFNLNQNKDKLLIMRLRNIGLISTYIGLEAGDNNQLKLYNKKINSSESLLMYNYLKYIGMAGATNGFINFFQGSTLEQIYQNIVFLRQTGFASFWNLLSRAETLPGIKINEKTEMYPRKHIWDVNNYHFIDTSVAKLYLCLNSISNNYYFARHEDRVIRKIRDVIKIRNFYHGYIGYSDKERDFDDKVFNIQINTKNFIITLIDRIKEGYIINIDDEIVMEYVSKMNNCLNLITVEYEDYLR